MTSQNPRYIKSFSKGQITVPKEFRETLGLGDIFWMQIYIEGSKIIAEPTKTLTNKKNYLDKLESIKSSWFRPQDIYSNRSIIEKRLNLNG